MTDLEQRVAAALRAARFFDEGPDAQDAVDLIAALASQGLAITEAPDAEYGTVRDWTGEPSTPSPLPSETPRSIAPDTEGAGLPPVNPDLIAVGSWGHYRPLKEADPAEYARLDALRRAAPPSSVDGEGLRAALERIAAVFHFDGSHNAGGGPPTFRDCADDNCRVATKALAASGSAPSAAEKGR